MIEAPPLPQPAERVEESSSARGVRGFYVLFALLATVHIAWFYVVREQAYLEPALYEHGLERMPFQGRMLMELPMRWAHASQLLVRLAASIGSTVHLWIRRPIIPEDLVEIPVNAVSIAVAAWVARALYVAKSRTGLLTPYVYPLALAMITVAYLLPAEHFFRFVYDLPAMGLFAAGLYLAQRRANPLLFAALFVVATINRETSLFLLPLFVGSRCIQDGRFRRERLRNAGTLLTAAILAAFWVGWRIWVSHHFAANRTEAATHVKLNLFALLWPYGWTQMASVACFLLPLIVPFAVRTRDAELRLWGAVMLVWAAFLAVFGIVIETRIFGELIPMLACMAALAAEQNIAGRLQALQAQTP